MVFARVLKPPEFYPHGFCKGFEAPGILPMVFAKALKHSDFFPMVFARVLKTSEFYPHGFCEGSWLLRRYCKATK